MRILHVASSYPLAEGDPTAPFMEEMLAAQVRNGHRVTVVVPRTEGLTQGQRHGVDVIGVPYAPRRVERWGYGRSLSKTGALTRTALLLTPFALAAITKAARLQLKSQPDIVHLHWVVPLGAISLAMPNVVPVVISAHGADAKLVDGRLRPLIRRVVQRADLIVAASMQILEKVSSVDPSILAKTVVIPHGAEASLFGSIDKTVARQQLGLSNSSSIVVAVGRLVPKKGFAHLIHAFGTLDNDNSSLIIVGDGSERSTLLSAAAEYPRADIRLVGPVNRPRVAEWLAASDVVAIPSVEHVGDIDSGPVVLMEAMASGRPVVATSVGMAPDVIVSGVNGYLLESTAPEHISRHLDLAIRNSAKLGEGATQTFAKVGDWSRVATELDDVYRRAIDLRRLSNLTKG